MKHSKYATEEQKQADERNSKAYCTREGESWSPLLKYPRNANCICGSGLKFKKCCINKVIPTVTTGSKDESTFKTITQIVRGGSRINFQRKPTEEISPDGAIENEIPVTSLETESERTNETT